MSVLMVTANGEEHGLIKTVANSVKDNGFAHMTPENKTKCEKQKKEDNRKVKARYINHRGMNERLTKPYCRWAGDPIHTYHLIPGETYDLPMGFVNEVNASGLVKRSKEDTDHTPVNKSLGIERIHELVPISF